MVFLPDAVSNHGIFPSNRAETSSLPKIGIILSILSPPFHFHQNIDTFSAISKEIPWSKVTEFRYEIYTSIKFGALFVTDFLHNRDLICPIFPFFPGSDWKLPFAGEEYSSKYVENQQQKSEGGTLNMDGLLSWKDQVRRTYTLLRPSEQTVADYLLNHPEEAEALTLDSLAQKAGVSQPTVLRFVQAMGFSGFKEFKHKIIRDNSGEPEKPRKMELFRGFDLSPHEDICDLPLKALNVSAELLEEMVKCVSLKAFQQAIQLILDARLIDIYGVENSFCPAFDLHTKLSYLGLCSRINTDTYVQHASASHLTEKDVAIAFSRSGQTAATVRAARLAQKAGASVIAISSNPDSPLSQTADVFLCVSGQKNIIYGDIIFSRVPDAALVDILYMGVLLQDYERFSKNLDQSAAAILD